MRIGNTYLNLMDAMKAENPKGGLWPLVEMLHGNSVVLQDAITVMCNSGMKHLHSIRTGLPEVAWGALYQGIPQSKSSRQNVEDTTGFIEGLASVDKRLIELFGDRGKALRMSEAQGFIEAMTQEMERAVFYADTATKPEAFKGIAARYNVIGGGGAGNQVIDAGGTGSDNTSIWAITWSEAATHLIHPQNTQIGIKREDKGEGEERDEVGRLFFVLRELFSWHLGLSVRDWRYNGRVANIDVSDLEAGLTNPYDHLRKLYYSLEGRKRARMGNRVDPKGDGDSSVPLSRTVIYMNRVVLEKLDQIGTNNNGADNFIRLVPKQIEGEEIMTYRGIPIRETDALLNTEARVPVAA